MNSHFSLSILVACCVLPMATAAEEESTTVSALTGEVTTKLHFFDYASGVGTDKNSFLERYHVQRGWGGDTRSGFYADLDLKLNYQVSEDSRITLERWGEGQYLHGGKGMWDTEQVQVRGYYDYRRAATNGLGYLYSPNQVPGGTDPSYFPPGSTNTASGYAAQFNDDSNRFLYEMSRFDYGLGFAIKPGVLGENTTASLDYTGYLRYGRSLQAYVLGGSDVTGGTASRVLQRWRGYSRNTDENNDRFTLRLSMAPSNLFTLNYVGILEKFNNHAPTLTQQDIPLVPPYVINSANPINPTRPLGFTPDSSLSSHNLRISKRVGSANLTAGYGTTDLDQDSFTQPQVALGYTKGQIKTEDAFFNFDSSLTGSSSLQGYIRYGSRENHSTYPVPGFINGAVGAGETLAVRINEIESVSYGLATVVRPKGTASTVTLGWKGEDKERDLTYHATGIIPSVSFYQTDTESDELYVKLHSRAVKNVSFRVSTSYAWADKTGLVTEPGQALGLKTAVTYSAPSGAVWMFYYNLKDCENDNNTVTDKNVTTPNTYAQDVNSTVQSSGASVSLQPDANSHVRLGLDWMRMDASVLYYESNRRRFESTTTFGLRDLTGSVVDTFTFSAGADRKLSEKVRVYGEYSVTASDGHLASGEAADELGPIDDTLDSAYHIVTVGADYELAKNRRLRMAYTYERYSDSAYSMLSGSIHSVLVALTFRL